MTMGDPAGPARSEGHSARAGQGLARVLRVLSIVTMAMTIPQVVAVWRSRGSSGVSVVSWGAYLVVACLWLVYGIQRRDKTIYLACIGWIVLDALVVIGALAHR
jgi:uncharacterized protein with PQ loop repeat